jgi:hypothetical protein
LHPQGIAEHALAVEVGMNEILRPGWEDFIAQEKVTSRNFFVGGGLRMR